MFGNIKGSAMKNNEKVRKIVSVVKHGRYCASCFYLKIFSYENEI